MNGSIIEKCSPKSSNQFSAPYVKVKLYLSTFPKIHGNVHVVPKLGSGPFDGWSCIREMVSKMI